MAKLRAKRRSKAGNSQAAAADRRRRFALAFIAHDHNATAAAIAVGLSPKTAYSAGQRMLKNVEVQAIIKEEAAKAAEAAGLSVEYTLGIINDIERFDPKDLYDDEGCLIPIHKLPYRARMALASIKGKSIRIADKDDPDDPAKERIVFLPEEIKPYSRLDAAEKAMKHFGLYEKDNHQKAEGLKIVVELV